jgi:hypothetical protein
MDAEQTAETAEHEEDGCILTRSGRKHAYFDLNVCMKVECGTQVGNFIM